METLKDHDVNLTALLIAVIIVSISFYFIIPTQNYTRIKNRLNTEGIEVVRGRAPSEAIVLAEPFSEFLKEIQAKGVSTVYYDGPRRLFWVSYGSGAYPFGFRAH